MSQVLTRPSPVLFMPQKQPAKPAPRRLEVVSEYRAGRRPADRHPRRWWPASRPDERDQVLLGVTGSGKTFTMAKVIEAVQKPTLILAPNKTLAAQLYGEMKSFFPEQRGRILRQLLRLLPAGSLCPAHRHLYREGRADQRADRPHAPRRDAGAAGAQRRHHRRLGLLHLRHRLGRDLFAHGGEAGDRRPDRPRQAGQGRWSSCNTAATTPPSSAAPSACAARRSTSSPAITRTAPGAITLFGDEIEAIQRVRPADRRESPRSSTRSRSTPTATTSRRARRSPRRSIDIKQELQAAARRSSPPRASCWRPSGCSSARTFDIEMMETTGSCKGIENYSRYLSGRNPGEPPPTLFEYLPENALLIVDESHVTVPQIGGMYRGDFARKSILAEFGFRLPSCIDNRPLKFEEWETFRPQTVFVSRHARPVGDGAHRRRLRRAGDPPDRADRPGDRNPPGRAPGRRPAGRMPHACSEKGGRVLVTTLTKRMAEDLTEYLTEHGVKVRYLHSDIDTLERIEIIRDLRLGVFDVLVGINLLREGLDIPGMRAGRDPRCRQGRLPALADQPDPDHRPRRAQRRRPRHPLCRHDDRQPAPRHRGDRAPPRQADGLERGARHHAAERQAARSATCCNRCSSRTT